MYNNVGIIILAAGQSKRLGHAKQLVKYRDKVLLQHAIDIALETDVAKVITILGARYQEIASNIDGSRSIILENQNWADGISTSIVCGLNFVISAYPDIDKVIFMVCDQPLVDPTLLVSLIEKNIKSQLPIIASQYGEIMGTPALFSKSMFDDLLRLEGDAGAGKMIKQKKELVGSIPFEGGEMDIDHQDDVVHLYNSNHINSHKN